MRVFWTVAKILALTGAISASPLFAHKLEKLKKPSTDELRDFRTLADDISAADAKESKKLKLVNSVRTVSHRISEISPKKKNEKPAVTMRRVLGYALHKTWPITGDDGGYSFIVLTKDSDEGTVEEALNEACYYYDENRLDGSKQLRSTLTGALKKGLLVFVGAGSGNNTIASIIAVADPENNEFVILIQSNFGSDS